MPSTLHTASSDTVTLIAAFLTIPELARLMHSRKELLDLLNPGFQKRVDAVMPTMRDYTRMTGNQLLLLFNKGRMFLVYSCIDGNGDVSGYGRKSNPKARLDDNDDVIFNVTRNLERPYVDVTFHTDKTTQVRVRVMPSSFTAGVIVLPGGAQREYQGDVAGALTREYPTLGTKF